MLMWINLTIGGGCSGGAVLGFACQYEYSSSFFWGGGMAENIVWG
jgi:hypothetical protein